MKRTESIQRPGGTPARPSRLRVAWWQALSVEVAITPADQPYMATLHGDSDGGRGVYMKGAVERLLERCVTAARQDGHEIPVDRERIHRETETLASQGLRVLAFARKPSRPCTSASGQASASR